jgi:predicted patatin/cPLA2 family phospholipase
MGFTDAFDAVYGSSAGAINAAYFLAGQARIGTTVYYEDINSRSFIDMRRAVFGRPIVDLGFLLDEVAVARKVLDVQRVLASASPLSLQLHFPRSAAKCHQS